MRAHPGPDFFIVGAPKCGTTSLNAYLQQHPAIFMAAKEQHFFGADLDELWTPPVRANRPTEEEYLAAFAPGADAQARGDASVWYLWSRSAAAEIHRFNPQARIIVMLRNPVDALPSLHSQYLFSGMENLIDFSDALAAEEDRRQGRRIPPNNGPEAWRLLYRDVMRFDEQLERYFEVFGRDRVQLVWFDDFAVDPVAAVREVLEFLNVDPDFEPVIRVENANKRVRSPALRQLVWRIQDPSSSVRRLGQRLIPPGRVRSAMLHRSIPALRRFNTTVQTRAPMSPEVRRQLTAELRPGIERLEMLVGRDLSGWYSPAGRS